MRELADTRIVVCAPGLGDDIQAIKAGVLEIADILVVNRGDSPLAPDTERSLREMLRLRRRGPWEVAVVRTTATTGEGIAALADSIETHAAFAGRGRRLRAQTPATIDDVAAVDRAITTRRSVRAFLPRPVPRATVERILAVASRAPERHQHAAVEGVRARRRRRRSGSRARSRRRSTPAPRRASFITTRRSGSSRISPAGARSAGTCMDCSASAAATRTGVTPSTGATTCSSTRRSG